jgi:hypothetical protein
MQLTGVSFKKLQTALAAAPFGYVHKGHRLFTDWRSWQGFFNEKYRLASIHLMQSFPDKLCVPFHAPPCTLPCQCARWQQCGLLHHSSFFILF